MLNQIDKQVKRGDMNVPVFIDATQAKRTIRTATYGGKKDVKTIIETENNDLNPYFFSSYRQKVEDLIHLEENNISMKRLDQVRSNTKTVIGVNDREDKIEIPSKNLKNVHRTMSVYGNKDKKLEVMDRPFTAIMQGDDIKYARNNELREIENIKKRFNRNEVLFV